MTLLAIPVWTDSSGSDTGPLNLPPRTDRKIEDQVAEAFAMARRAGGLNARVLVVDDVEWRTVARLRTKPNRRA